MDIVRGLLKKAERENRTEEMKERIREHLTRSKDNNNDSEILAQFLYENEGQPRAVRAMNLEAQMNGEDAWVSDSTLSKQSVERRKAVKASALSDSFSSSADSDVSIEDEVEEILARAEDLNNCEGVDAGKAAYNFAIDNMDDRDVENLVNSFAHRAFVQDTSFTAKSDDYAYAMVKKMEEDELIAMAYACSYRCVID